MEFYPFEMERMMSRFEQDVDYNLSESGVHPVRLFDVSDLKVKIGGDIYDWDPTAYIAPKEAKRIEPLGIKVTVQG